MEFQAQLIFIQILNHANKVFADHYDEVTIGMIDDNLSLIGIKRVSYEPTTIEPIMTVDDFIEVENLSF